MLLSAMILLTSCSNQPSQNQQALPSVVSGKLIRLDNFRSDYIKARHVDIWLSPSFNAQKPVTLLIMHDGQMLFDSSLTWNKQEWGVDEALSMLTAEGEIENVLVAGIWNGGADRHSEYFPQQVFEALPSDFKDSLMVKNRNENVKLFSVAINSDAYLQFIVDELIPYLEQNHMNNSGAKATYIAGSSMGGLISIYALCSYPEVFDGAACISTHWPGIFTIENNPIPAAFVQYIAENIPTEGKHRIYFDYGTETLDKYYEGPQLAIDSVMLMAGYDNDHWQSLKFEGADHSENAWQKRFPEVMRFLLANH
jgi:enterochelin esterase-like enzyme